MSDEDAPSEQLPSEFESALKKLKRLFAGALGDAKVESCCAAWSDIKGAKSRKKKIEILDEKTRQWREGSVEAIREWFPRFVDLGEAYAEPLHGDALQWATDRVWEIVEKQCGIRRPKPHEPTGHDSISRTMVFWFAMASKGDSEVNGPPPRPWKAPGWLARSDEQRDSLLREHAGHLCLRLNHVINEEIDAAEIRRAISRRDRGGGKEQATETDSDRRGRPPRLTSDFVLAAGKLWQQAQRQSVPCRSKVAHEKLVAIASSLDSKGYIPPADYLEPNCAAELRNFNSHNSNSKTGRIKTWSQLVMVGDKDHLRGMRRLLSRCAKKLSSCSPPLSGN